MAIFESVEFLNDTKIIIEGTLIEEDEILNESIIFKFVKKKDVPESFRDEALKICERIEKESGKSATLGSGANAFRDTFFGIKLNKAMKKIETGKLKNCYILGFSNKDISKAAGVENKVYDYFLINLNTIQDYVGSTLKKLGYKPISNKAGANKGYYKELGDYICGVDCGALQGGTVNIYIRCLQNTDDNKKILAGGKQFI